MIHEVIYYGFDDVPIEVGDRYREYKCKEGYREVTTIYPWFNLVKNTGSKDVNKWILFLSKQGIKNMGNRGFTSGYLFIGIWNTGWGNYKF